MNPTRTQRLSQVAAEILGDPSIKEHLLGEGLLTVGGSPQDFQRFVETEISNWGKIVQASGASAG
ncbi:hypothetical protein GOQ25_03940 [Bordetella sp. 15P40C-2]|nr:hypothetical protein [Bordetella sp. 15P40C-2]